MRAHVTIIGLWTFLGLSTAERTNWPLVRDAAFIGPNEVVLLGEPLNNETLFDARSNTTAQYSASGGTTITNVYLREYSLTGVDDDDDKIIGTGSVSTAAAGTGTDTQAKAELERRASNISLIVTTNDVQIPWPVLERDDYTNKALYLQFVWENKTSSGTSCSPIFAGYPAGQSSVFAKGILSGTSKPIGEPAREENITYSSTATTSTASNEPTAQATTGATTETPSSAPAPSQSGLDKKGIIGVAVGAGGAGLLIAGVLIYFFCFRRRRNNASRQGSVSYGSDSGAQVMMTGKEVPAISESSPQSAYGGEGRTSAAREAPYAPYADRPITPPEAPRPIPAASTPGATSQTDLSSTRGADTPTPAISARYAHLVEEGMTEHEIRQLEEEEQHLDAAIAAGRRVPS
ncbi:hypothetical protein F5Y18DRAFT_287536 [Xylariaceae sp. FL1019]|nr:hypothetical protein F5Y18DRAFT_287536 [Xylariaceae sp. FL1019]